MFENWIFSEQICTPQTTSTSFPPSQRNTMWEFPLLWCNGIGSISGALGHRFHDWPSPAQPGPARHTGLRIWHCHSCSIGCNCGSVIPGLGTPYAMGEPKKKKKKKKGVRYEALLQAAGDSQNEQTHEIWAPTQFSRQEPCPSLDGGKSTITSALRSISHVNIAQGIRGREWHFLMGLL